MPESDHELGPRRAADDLRRLARYQRWVVGVVLAQVAMWLCCLALLMIRGEDLQTASRFPLAITVVLGCVGAVFAFLIYCTIRNPVIALVMAAACIPPLLGIFALAVVNGVVTRELQADGVPVGIFGADADAIDDAPGWYDEDEGW